MGRQIFLQCISEESTSGLLGSASQAFRTFKEIIRNGYGRFHTFSITRNRRLWKSSLPLCAAFPRILGRALGRNSVQVRSLRKNASTQESASGEEFRVQQGGAGG